MAKLYFYYSAMNAAKSTTLLQSAYNYHERGMRTVLFTPQLDNRYGVGQITSRIGLQADALIFDAQRDLFQAERDYLKARYDYIRQMLELEELVGNLDEDDVRRVNALLVKTD